MLFTYVLPLGNDAKSTLRACSAAHCIEQRRFAAISCSQRRHMNCQASWCSLIQSRASEAVLAAREMLQSDPSSVARCLLSKASAGDACLCSKPHPSIQELDKAITRYEPSPTDLYAWQFAFYALDSDGLNRYPKQVGNGFCIQNHWQFVFYGCHSFLSCCRLLVAFLRFRMLNLCATICRELLSINK